MSGPIARTSGLFSAAQVGAALLLCGCASFVAKGSNVPEPPSCGINGFTRAPNEHIVVELGKTLRVRSVGGVITSQGGNWPEGTFVVFELRPTDGAGKVRRVTADSQGAFHVPGVPAGAYCFKATADGWQTVVGAIVVTHAADRGARVTFEMRLGV